MNQITAPKLFETAMRAVIESETGLTYWELGIWRLVRLEGEWIAFQKNVDETLASAATRDLAILGLERYIRESILFPLGFAGIREELDLAKMQIRTLKLALEEEQAMSKWSTRLSQELSGTAEMERDE